MKAFVLDNSVTMRWCFQNAVHPYADGVLQQLVTGEAFVPVLWRYEASAVLAKSQKDGFLSAAKASAFLTTLETLNIHVDQDGVRRIFTDVHRIAITHRLTSYDAAYLELAIRKGLPLATLDAELIVACKVEGQPVL